MNSERGVGLLLIKEMEAITVQVLDATLLGNGGIQVSIACCFCGKKHVHGSGVDDFTGVKSLGKRVPHCTPPAYWPQYELRLDAWHVCGKKVKKAKAEKRKRCEPSKKES